MAELMCGTNGGLKLLQELDVEIVTVIGRNADSTVEVDDERCSRQHAELVYNGSEWILRDLDSKNGTNVNGERIVGEVSLRHLDSIRIGRTDLVFTDAESDAGSKVGSVTAWLDKLEASETDTLKGQAQHAIWNRYHEQLTSFARRRRSWLPEAVENEEDAALGALHSFFDGVSKGHFPELQNREDLWRILATITARKVCRQFERLKAKKRGSGKVVGEAALRGKGESDAFQLDNLGTSAAWPPRSGTIEVVSLEFRETLETLIDGLNDETSKRIAQLTLEGRSTTDVAEELGVSKRTIERRLAKIREVWEPHLL